MYVVTLRYCLSHVNIACHSSCSSCIGNAKNCTRCSDHSLFAFDGSCIDTCPRGTISTNGTCEACSTDCATCSTPSSVSSCLSCPPARPVLSNGRCIEYCDQSSYLDIVSSTCKSCDSSCSSCIDSGSNRCTGCPDNFVLRSGSCVGVSCGKGGFAAGLGVCLSTLVNSSNSKWAAFATLPAMLLIIRMGFWLYVRRERRKTRLATREFADGLDERGGRHRRMVLRLERVLGLERVPTQPEPAPRLGKERNKPRELLLPSRIRHENIPLDQRINKVGNDRRDSHWVLPPPPYISSHNASAGTIATTVLIDDPDCKTRIVSAGSPVSPEFQPRALFPPPRPRIDSGAEREVIRQGGLNDLWSVTSAPSSAERRTLGDGRIGRMEHTWI